MRQFISGTIFAVGLIIFLGRPPTFLEWIGCCTMIVGFTIFLEYDKEK